jgi:hypothetical protein
MQGDPVSTLPGILLKTLSPDKQTVRDTFRCSPRRGEGIDEEIRPSVKGGVSDSTIVLALQRVQAEEFLHGLYNQQGYAMLLFQIIEMHAAGPAEPDVSIRKAAAVSFKVRTTWN